MRFGSFDPDATVLAHGRMRIVLHDWNALSRDYLLTAHGSAAATVGTIITGNSNSALSSGSAQMAYIPTAADTFDFIVGGNVISTGSGAGVIDVFLTYIPLPSEDLSTSEFLSYSF